MAFYIVDGHAAIYRACLTKGPELSSPGGEPTKGTYFFTRWLLGLLRERSPTYLAFCVDGPRETLARRALDRSYKANRKSQDNGVHQQALRCLEIVKSFGIRVLRSAEWEADDLIASLCARFQEETDITIIGRDKDLHQLVTDKVTVYDPVSDKKWDPEAVKQKWGVWPEKTVEIQILLGDSNDNVPGVKGIGETRALELVKGYGTADAAKESGDQLTPALRRNLEEADLALLRSLVTLRTDLFEGDRGGLAQFGYHGVSSLSRRIFSELGFKRWAG